MSYTCAIWASYGTLQELPTAGSSANCSGLLYSSRHRHAPGLRFRLATSSIHCVLSCALPAGLDLLLHLCLPS
jgi:hypothetical protein